MKALSLWQPWATLIACGSKTIETRSWSTNYRGPIAIHAAKKVDLPSLESFADEPALASSLWKTGFAWPADASRGAAWLKRSLPFGALVVVADLYGCLRTESLRRFGVDIDSPRYPGGDLDRAPWCERDLGDFSPGRFAWVLQNVRVLNMPIHYRGAQGLFDVSDAILAGNAEPEAQAERLALLAEEMGEAIQVIGKILRHGYDSRNPLKHDAATNRWLLEGELGHVLAAMCLLQESGDLSTEAISDLRDLKLKTVSRWLHHQPSPSPASDESTGDTA